MNIDHHELLKLLGELQAACNAIEASAQADYDGSDDGAAFQRLSEVRKMRDRTVKMAAEVAALTPPDPVAYLRNIDLDAVSVQVTSLSERGVSLQPQYLKDGRVIMLGGSRYLREGETLTIPCAVKVIQG